MTRVDLARLSDVSSGLPSGTAFPGSPATSDVFFRTDLGLLCYYDGTRWVTMDLYSMAFGASDALDGSTSNINYARMSPWHTTYALWLDAFYASVYLATTNDGSNFWTVALQKFDAGGSGTTVATFATSGDTVNNYNTHRVSISAVMATTSKHLTVGTTKTGSPGGVYLGGHMTYRLIVT